MIIDAGEKRCCVGLAWRRGLAQASKIVQPAVYEVMFEEIAEEHGTIDRSQFANGPVLVHGATLSLGGSEPVEEWRIEQMARVADFFDAPMVSEHVAYVRAGEKDAWHLLPLPRTRLMIELFAENLRAVRKRIDRPFALENISSLFEWPDSEFSEPSFLTQLLEYCDAQLILDIENVRIVSANFGHDPWQFIQQLPLHRLAYVHLAGGEYRDNFHRDTHSESVSDETLSLLTKLCEVRQVPYIILERDANLPTAQELQIEFDRIASAIEPAMQQAKCTR